MLNYFDLSLIDCDGEEMTIGLYMEDGGVITNELIGKKVFIKT